MTNSVNAVDFPATLPIRQAAWVLGIPQSAVHRAIRVGVLRTVRRRSRLVVVAADVHRLLSSDVA
jgi:hypothetical protein